MFSLGIYRLCPARRPGLRPPVGGTKIKWGLRVHWSGKHLDEFLAQLAFA